MSIESTFKQEAHKLLVIPGPIEIADDVLYANAHPSLAHTSPEFIPVFGNCIRYIRKVVYTTKGQPFLIAGSGTLGWDQVAANLVEPGEHALVLNSGYFGDKFAEALETYGAKVDQLRAELGISVMEAEVENALMARKYKVLTLTHVDTSTGVLSNPKRIAETVRRVSPNTLVVLDAVCSVASEELRFDDWDLDVVVSGSQKGLGAPPGLSVVVASPRAIKVCETRTTPVSSYYASWRKWLPIMRAYEEGRPMYFATPPVNLIIAFHTSLKQIVEGTPSLEDRLRLHRETSQRVKDAVRDLGLTQVPVDDSNAANGMTAVYYPKGVSAADLLPRLASRNVVVAGGLHSAIRDEYFRIGHMGLTAIDPNRGDIDKVLNSLTEALAELQNHEPLL